MKKQTATQPSLLVARHICSWVQFDPQAPKIGLEGNASPLQHDLAPGMPLLVHRHRVLLEEHGQKEDRLLQGKLPANAPTQILAS